MSKYPSSDGAIDVTYIENRIFEIVGDQLGYDRKKLTRKTNFYDDLEIDEISVTELAMEFEHEFDIDIPDEEIEKFQTMGNVTDYIICLVKPVDEYEILREKLGEKKKT